MKRKYTKSSKEQKILVLQSMLAKKDILFGKFTGCITKREIATAWTDIVSLALSYGLVADPDEDRFRRLTWQNWRRNTMAKIDRMKRTGIGGASPSDIMDEGDKLVLAIVGEDIAYGLDILESDGRNDSVPPAASVPRQPVPATVPLPSDPAGRRAQSNAQLKHEMEVEEHEEKMKLYKANYYCRQLEAREKEINLGLPISDLTAPLYLSDGRNKEADV